MKEAAKQEEEEEGRPEHEERVCESSTITGIPSKTAASFETEKPSTSL